MRLKSIYFLPFSLLVLIGCTALGEKYTAAPPPPDNKALVYLFRTSVSTGGFWRTSFFVNYKEIAALHNGGYTWVHLDKGKNVFEAKATNHKDLGFDTPLQAGKTYYIEFTQENISYNHDRNILRVIPPEQGEKMISSYLYKKANQ